MADVLYTSKSKKSVDSVLLAEIGVDDENQVVEINPVGKITTLKTDESIVINQIDINLDLPIEIWEKLEEQAKIRKISMEDYLIQIINEYIKEN